MTCPYISSCPYYERQTSYGTEEVKCANTDCILHAEYEEREYES